jgi:hypothetical protein
VRQVVELRHAAIGIALISLMGWNAMADTDLLSQSPAPREAPGTTVESGAVLLSDQFEGGRANGPVVLGQHHFQLTGWDFRVRLANTSDAGVTARVSCLWGTDGGQKRQLYLHCLRGGEWEDVSCSESTRDDETLDRQSDVELKLGAGEEVYVTGPFWIPYSRLSEWLQQKAELSTCEVRRIYTTPGGRDMWAATVTDPDVPDDAKRRLLLMGSPQVFEWGEAPCAAALEFLTGDDQRAAKIRRQWIVDVIPYSDPDAAVNADVPNQLFDAPAAVAGEPDSNPNMRAQWEWIEAHRPDVAIEFHGENRLKRDGQFYRVYANVTGTFEDAAKAALSDRVRDGLVALPDGGLLANLSPDSWKETLAFVLAERLGTAAFLYAVHQRYGYEANWERGVEVLLTATATAE